MNKFIIFVIIGCIIIGFFGWFYYFRPIAEDPEEGKKLTMDEIEYLCRTHSEELTDYTELTCRRVEHMRYLTYWGLGIGAILLFLGLVYTRE